MSRDGLVLAIAITITGLLRLTGSTAPATLPKVSLTAAKVREGQASLRSSYPELLAAKVGEFYGTFGKGASSSGGHWNVPGGSGKHIRFVIAIVPDPVHTHLGLFFDRSIEALQQAAQRQSYIFDRAILPWVRTSSSEAAQPKQSSDDGQRERESYPGLLIFRKGRELNEPASGATKGARIPPPKAALFVLVVGETPTGGLNREQFRNTLQIMREMRGRDRAEDDPLLLLGPSFSGSLQSLDEELSNGVPPERSIYAYSGSVTSASSINWFERRNRSSRHFASFQENDDYTLAEFVAFAKSRGYTKSEIAVLSEDETVYGAVAPQGGTIPQANDDVVHLHFPREISFFRAAYQKEVAAQQQPTAKAPRKSTLPLDLEETGSDDDKVALYGGLQTPLSQEAVMLGIVSELQKHRIKFTVLLATDPVDQLFLARYLRTAYPQGRVVVTVPDLLLSREEDAVLHGVLGINSYPLLPGYDDVVGQVSRSEKLPREDRVFVSSLSVGTFNAMLGLLEITASPGSDHSTQNFLPPASYAEYGRPKVRDASEKSADDTTAPLLWLTILGREGYLPIVGLDRQGLRRRDGPWPVASFPNDGQMSTLKEVAGSPAYPLEQPMHVPTSWKVSYCLCLLLMSIHAWFSMSGTILSSSESMAQFAVTVDRRRSFILAIGGWLLATVFTLMLCTRNPLLDWAGGTALTLVLWLPLPIFVAMLTWDFAARRRAANVAILFVVSVLLSIVSQILLVCVPNAWLQDHSVYWSTRVLYVGSGVSPVLPVGLLIYAGYWWMWFALRGAALVDLRRPRLPEVRDLPAECVRISECEAEKLRFIAHPLSLPGVVLIPVLAMGLVSLTVLDLRHPLQTLEGWSYDWGYALLLGSLIGVFVGCLIKIVYTWLECRQVLAGLDRLPVREAFARMNGLSWKSMWSPGGSTLRETYKVLSQAIECMRRLNGVLEGDVGLAPDALSQATQSVKAALESRDATLNLYKASFEKRADDQQTSETGTSRMFTRISNLDALGTSVEHLQKHLAKTAAVLMQTVLKAAWSAERSPVVSQDTQATSALLPPVRLLAEEFVALIYVNFVVSVLLRIRNMVICAGGLYVFIVCSISVYPFEPHPALQTLSVVMLLFGAATVGSVYAGMHRDAILSRLTATNAGELGLDFWLKFASAGAIPLFSLLAVQFPEINQVLFSWLEPALQAVK